MKNRSMKKIVFLGTATILFAACGGGGGSSVPKSESNSRLTGSPVENNLTVENNATTVENNITVENSTSLVWDRTVSLSDGCSTSGKRQPTIEELQTLVDYSKKGVPLKGDLNITVKEREFSLSSSDGWALDQNGGVRIADANNTLCVEGSSKIFTITATVNADGNITTSNGLVWMDKLFYEGNNTYLLTYDKAKSICPTGWRLPTVVELDSIYDRKNKKVIVSFSKPMGAVFWTSTEGANHPKYNWTVNLNDNNERYMGVIEGANREENG
jgi:hypothetical protein